MKKLVIRNEIIDSILDRYDKIGEVTVFVTGDEGKGKTSFILRLLERLCQKGKFGTPKLDMFCFDEISFNKNKNIPRAFLNLMSINDVFRHFSNEDLHGHINIFESTDKIKAYDYEENIYIDIVSKGKYKFRGKPGWKMFCEELN